MSNGADSIPLKVINFIPANVLSLLAYSDGFYMERAERSLHIKTIGVPQGLIRCATRFNFGTFTFFLIYINDFQNCLKNSNLIMYADDTNVIIKEKNINTLYARPQNELINVYN